MTPDQENRLLERLDRLEQSVGLVRQQGDSLKAQVEALRQIVVKIPRREDVPSRRGLRSW